MTRKKSTADKGHAGNPGRRSTPEHEPKLDAALLEAPDHLGPHALVEWNRVAPILAAKGITTILDRATLVCYCDCWETMIVADRKVEDEGHVLTGEKGGEYINPWHNIKLAAMKGIKTFGAELGMGAVSRSSVHAIPAEEEKGGKGRLVKVG